MKDDNDLKKFNGSVVQDGTIQEHFKELHGITIEEWHENNFKAKTGMTTGEWYINQITKFVPIDYLKERYGKVTEEDVSLVRDLKSLGLKDVEINVLLDYVETFESVGLIPPAPRDVGESWSKQKFSSIENVIIYARTEWNRHTESMRNK